jgi:iron complex outermembrane receptor protein
MDPTQTVRDENSPFGGYWSWMGGDGNLIKIATKNPLAMLEMKDDRAKSYQLTGNVQFDYKLHYLPELHLNLNLGIDYIHSEGYTNIPTESPMQNLEYTYNNDWRQDRKNPLLDFYANYKKDLGFLASNLDIMAGYSWQHFWHKDPYVRSETGRFDENGNPLVYEGTNLSEYYLISFFGRLNYSVVDKYLFTFSLRNDASSRFLKGHQWGLFPSAAWAWRIKEGTFLKNIALVSNLKLRLGWGITGQQDLGRGDYPAVDSYQYSEGTAANYYMGDHWVEFIKPLAYNPVLTWEKTMTYNAGLDYGFFNNRVSGAIDFYHRKTADLFNAEVRVAAATNFSEYIPANVGSLENRGLEFAINAIPLVTKDWQWEAGFNLAYNKNKITQLTLSKEKNARLSPFGSTGGDGGRPLKIHQTGYPSGMFYVYEQVYDLSVKPVEGLYVDRNNDDNINEEDLYIYHKAAPDWIFGFNTKLTWKIWDYSIASHGSLSNYNYNGMDSNHAGLSISQVYYGGYLSNRYRSAFDSGFQMKQVQSDYYIQDASFYRIDNITL